MITLNLFIIISIPIYLLIFWIIIKKLKNSYILQTLLFGAIGSIYLNISENGVWFTRLHILPSVGIEKVSEIITIIYLVTMGIFIVIDSFRNSIR